MCIKTKTAPRLHEVLVSYKYVFRLGQNTTFKTCFPCRRNTHLYIPFLHKWVVLLGGRFGNYHFVLAKRQFVAMHYNCFCVKLLFLHIIQRPHPTPILQDESCVNLKISKTIGKTKQINKKTKRSMPKPSKTIGMFKCTLDSSKRLGRGYAPLLNKAFTLHDSEWCSRLHEVLFHPLCMETLVKWNAL